MTMIQQRLGVLYFILFLLLAQCSSLEKQTQDQAHDIARTLIDIIDSQKTPQWFDFNILNFPILLVSRQKESTFLLKDRKLSKVPFQQWKLNLSDTTQGFNFVEKDGELLLAIYWDPDSLQPKRILRTILQEGFHLFYQKDQRKWRQPHHIENHGIIYPLESIPRYYRYEIAKN